VCHEEESKVLTDPEANVSYLFGDTNAYEDCAVKVKEGDNIVLSGIDDNGNETDMKFTVMHTPGHTPGCICLYNEEEKLMLTGDTLFAGGYGRTDFKYGSGAELMRSLRRLLSMEDEIVFYSGHGEMSRIGWEKV
jgi:glyoxylase-like metal-dependent hydrolase (beta-lactamase superfamily II)